MAISWLFEINGNYWSTGAVTYDGHNYLAKIDPDTFEGVTLRYDLGGHMIAPNDVSFEVLDKTGALSRTDLKGKYCLISRLTDGSLDRSWKFKIQDAVYYYGVWKCQCVDFLQEFLDGQYPNSSHPFELWPSDDIDLDDLDDMCVPVVLGTAYIPVMSVNTGAARYYVIGDNTVPTYTISEVQSPHEWNEAPTSFASGSYTFNQSNDDGYKLAQFLIHNPSGDGSTYYNGLYPTGSGFYPVLCKYSRSDTSSLTSFEEWIEYILEDWGIDSGDIDTGVGSTFESAGTLFGTRSITCNGGFWKKENRESLLAELLRLCDSVLIVADKIELHPFSATSVETITSADVKKFTYSPSVLTQSASDGGRVAWPKASAPQDVFPGKAIVGTYDGATPTKPSSDVLTYRFDTDSQRAQIAATLHNQKQHDQEFRVSFDTKYSKLTNADTLIPSQVITINDSNYGASFNAIIESISFEKDDSVGIECVCMGHIEDWDDIVSTSAISITADSSDGFSVPDNTTENMHYITVGPNDGDAMYSDLEAAATTLGSTAGKLFMRNGSYSLTETMSLPSYDASFIGESRNNTIINISVDDGMFERTSDTNAIYIFQNLTINMYSEAGKTTGNYAFYFHNTSCTIILDNCTLNLWDAGSYAGQGDYGIYYNVQTSVSNSPKVYIQNGTVINGGKYGAYSNVVDIVNVTNSQFNDQLYCPIYALTCGSVFINNNELLTAYFMGSVVQACDSAVITENVISVRGGSSLTYGLYININDKIKVNSNILRMSSSTAAKYGFYIGGTVGTPVRGWEINGNYIYIDAWLGTGIPARGIYLSYVSNSFICNNTIDMDVGDTDSVSYGVRLTNSSSRNTVDGNIISNLDDVAADTAIEIDSGCNYNNGENITEDWSTDLDNNGTNNTVTVVAS